MFEHLPVLLAETLTQLLPTGDELAALAAGPEAFVLVDCTLGGAGHASALIRALDETLPEGKEIRLVAFDRDAQARAAASERLTLLREQLAGTGRAFTYLIHPEDFARAGERLREAGLRRGVALLLADFGVSSPQLDTPERGFSLQRPGPLDMRMDAGEGGEDPRTAMSILQTYTERELERLFREFGEEPRARKLAAAVVKDREAGTLPLSNTVEFASWCARVLGYHNSRVHPATRIFQALRIEVNRELEAIDALLDCVPDVIAAHGRAGFISFHSLEDRPVKRRLRAWQKAKAHANDDEDAPLLPWEEARSWGREVPRGGVVASDVETRANPRARSARLRVFRFVGFEGEGDREVPPH